MGRSVMRPRVFHWLRSWPPTAVWVQRAACQATLAAPGTGPVSSRLPADPSRVWVAAVCFHSTATGSASCAVHTPGRRVSCTVSRVESIWALQLPPAPRPPWAFASKRRRWVLFSALAWVVSTMAAGVPDTSTCASRRRQVALSGAPASAQSRRGTCTLAVAEMALPWSCQPPVQRAFKVASPATFAAARSRGTPGNWASQRWVKPASVVCNCSSPSPCVLAIWNRAEPLAPGSWRVQLPRVLRSLVFNANVPLSWASRVCTTKVSSCNSGAFHKPCASTFFSSKALAFAVLVPLPLVSASLTLNRMPPSAGSARNDPLMDAAAN